MERLRIIFFVAALVLAAGGIAPGQPELYWGVHLVQEVEIGGGFGYGFDAYASFSGTVTTPLSETLPLGAYWESSLAALEARFPDGIYTFDDGEGGIYDAELSGSFPGEFPNITFYAFTLGGDLVINWDPWVLGKSNPVICIMFDDSDYYVELDPGATGYVIPAAEIPANNPLSGTVQFKNRVIEVGGGTHGDKIKGSSFIMSQRWGPSVSGLIFMPYDVPDIGYSLDEGGLLYFYSSTPVWSYNFTTSEWNTEGAKGLIYADWPFIYEFDTSSLWFALPPASGLWVYHFSTGQWTILPRIIP